MSELPLFPLEVVLFPQSSLPLHIYEDRYKSLVNACIATSQEFGINLVQDGKIADIGCSAEVMSVLKKYADGRFDIIVEGRRRYALQRYTADSTPYLLGTVRFLQQSQEPVDTRLGIETVDLYNTLIAIVYREKLPAQAFDPTRENLSFTLAQKVGLDLHRRQLLLELSSETKRLELVHDYLKEVIPKLEHVSEVERVIRSDGYL